jgi:hypothetical protein
MFSYRDMASATACKYARFGMSRVSEVGRKKDFIATATKIVARFASKIQGLNLWHFLIFSEAFHL